MSKTERSATMVPSVGAQVERVVRALDLERAAFEKWLMDVHMLDGTWNEARSCYDEFPCHLAFQAWRAARPKRAEIGRLVNLAAECAQRKPLRTLEPLTGVSHIGHRQFGRAYAGADEAVRLLAIELRRVADAL
jgi:hypothetical protein